MSLNCIEYISQLHLFSITLILNYTYSQLHLFSDESDSFRDNIWELFIESAGEDEIRNLYGLIQNGFYEEDGIYSWHEFLYSVMKDWFFKDLKERRWAFSFNNPLNALFFRSTRFSNSHFSYEKNGIQLRYMTRRGLEIITEDVCRFEQYFKRRPTQFDFPEAMKKLYMNKWSEFGINTWEEFMAYGLSKRRRTIENLDLDYEILSEHRFRRKYCHLIDGYESLQESVEHVAVTSKGITKNFKKWLIDDKKYIPTK